MRGGSGAFMGFALGACVVLLAGLVWYIATDGDPLNQRSEVTIELPEF